MLMPSIFGENLLDDFFGEPFGGYDYSESGLMTTDVKDTDKGYEVTQNLHKKISTHLLTVLTISVILQLEQRKGNKKR